MNQYERVIKKKWEKKETHKKIGCTVIIRDEVRFYVDGYTLHNAGIV